MSERFDDTQLEIGLREGLRNLPVPETSPDFAARIHTALEQTPSWWQTLWLQARPLLSGGVCAAGIMLLLLPTLTQMPSAAPSDSSGRRATLVALDAMLDRPDLSASSLREFYRKPSRSATRTAKPPAAAPSAPPARRSPESRAPAASHSAA